MSIIEKAANKLRKSANASTKQSSANEIVPSKESKAPLSHGDMPAKITTIDQTLSPPATETNQVNQIFIDLDKLNKLGIVTPDQGKTQVAEQFRVIKRPLLTKAFADPKTIKNGNLIMVASSLAGEGKVFVQ